MNSLIAIFLSATIALSAAGASVPQGGGGGSQTGGSGLVLVTGGTAGTYYEYGSLLAQTVGDTTDTSITVDSSYGSQANVWALYENRAELAFVQADVLTYALEGTRMFEYEPCDGICAVAALYPEVVQILTMDPDIRTVSDLKGKAVALGSFGSSTYYNAVDVLAAHGLTEDDIVCWTAEFSDIRDRLADGSISAAFVTASLPTASIEESGLVKALHLVELEGEAMDRLLADRDFYTKAVIPAGTYANKSPVYVPAVPSILVAREDVSEEDVYSIMQAIFENTDSIAAAHPQGANLDLGWAASLSGVPYHPGAVRYYIEHGKVSLK